MSKVGFAFSVFAIVAIATWAYNVNYRTRTTLDRVDQLRAEIAAEREHIQVLEVEWAWLNNPDRLARLAAQHADRLGLEPMSPAQFGRAAAVPFPPEPEPQPDPLATQPPAASAVVAGLALPPEGAVVPRPRPVPRSRE